MVQGQDRTPRVRLRREEDDDLEALFDHQADPVAHVVAHNHVSIRVLEKCGFRRDRTQEAGAPGPDGVEELWLVLAPQPAPS